MKSSLEALSLVGVVLSGLSRVRADFETTVQRKICCPNLDFSGGDDLLASLAELEERYFSEDYCSESFTVNDREIRKRLRSRQSTLTGSKAAKVESATTGGRNRVEEIYETGEVGVGDHLYVVGNEKERSKTRSRSRSRSKVAHPTGFSINFERQADLELEDEHCLNLQMKFTHEAQVQRKFNINFLNAFDVESLAESEVVKVRATWDPPKMEIDERAGGSVMVLERQTEKHADFELRKESWDHPHPPPLSKDIYRSRCVNEEFAARSVGDKKFLQDTTKNFHRVLKYLLLTSLRGKRGGCMQYKRGIAEAVHEKFAQERGATLQLCGKDLKIEDFKNRQRLENVLLPIGEEAIQADGPIRGSFYVGTVEPVVRDCAVFRFEEGADDRLTAFVMTFSKFAKEYGDSQVVATRGFDGARRRELHDLFTFAYKEAFLLEGPIFQLCGKAVGLKDGGVSRKIADHYQYNFNADVARHFYGELPLAGPYNCLNLAVYGISRAEYMEMPFNHLKKPLSVIISRTTPKDVARGKSPIVSAVPFWNVSPKQILKLLDTINQVYKQDAPLEKILEFIIEKNVRWGEVS